MEHLTSQNIMVMFLSLGILLGVARLLGELAQRMHQPAVLGELIAGVLLGPTVLGNLFPEFSAFVFPAEGPCAIALDAIGTLAIALFLMVAGIEVDLSTIWRQGRIGLKTGIASIIVPFGFGIAAAWVAPQALGRQPDADPLVFSLFFAVAVSISALPIIAKTLMDMNLYRTDLGMVVLSAAIVNDLIGWIVFGVVLKMMGDTSGSNASPVLLTILLIMAFSGAMLTAGRYLIHKLLPFVQAYSRWPSGEISLVLILGLLGAAFTEWIGIHAIFGAFLVGAAIGDSSHLRERTRVTVDNFISFFFAPVFFASIGLRVNFWAHFDLTLVMTVVIITCVFKLSGGVLGARWGGMPVREAWATGFGMVSVGAMGIIIGLLALNAGIIRPRLFVALVIMAIFTSMISGPMMRFCLRSGREKRLLMDVLSQDLFIRDLQARTRRTAIQELTAAACRTAGLDEKPVETAVWEREKALSTGLGNGVAMPHARLDGLSKALVAIGLSEAGIDFDAPDGRPAHVVFLILTPSQDSGVQLEIVSQIAKLFRDPQFTERVLHTKNFTEFLALVNTVTQLQPA